MSWPKDCMAPQRAVYSPLSVYRPSSLRNPTWLVNPWLAMIPPDYVNVVTHRCAALFRIKWAPRTIEIDLVTVGCGCDAH